MGQHRNRLRPILTQLALLRKSCDAFKEGRFELVEAGPDLLHYRRVGPTQSAEIALNRSNALRVITAFGKAAEVNPIGFTILVEDNATAHLQAGPAGPAAAPPCNIRRADSPQWKQRSVLP